MGYCNGDCKHLEKEKRHTCAKYGKKLAYIKQSGSFSYEAHGQCQSCVDNKWIHKLEQKLKCKFVKYGCLEEECKRCTHGGFTLNN